MCRRNLGTRAQQGEAWAPTVPSASPLSFLTSHPHRPPLNCSMGRSSDMVNASRWVWANRRPGKVRKAPSMEPRAASPTRMASLARGSLGRKDESAALRLVSTLPASHSLSRPPLPFQDSRPVPALHLQKWLQVLGHTGQAWGRQGEEWSRVDPWASEPTLPHSQMSFAPQVATHPWQLGPVPGMRTASCSGYVWLFSKNRRMQWADP